MCLHLAPSDKSQVWEVSGEEECHLLRLVRRGRPLLQPPLSARAPLFAVHLSLQLLQTPLHTRRHLQTARERMSAPRVTRTFAPAQEWHQRAIDEKTGN